MNRLPAYPADHPVAIAFAGIVCAARTGCGTLDALADCAERVGVRPFSDYFDDAAELLGFFYSRPLDLYVDRETKRRADALPYDQLHLAFAH